MISASEGRRRELYHSGSWSLEGDKLESREIAAAIPTMDVGLAWAKDLALAAPAKAFIEFAGWNFSQAFHGLWCDADGDDQGLARG